MKRMLAILPLVVLVACQRPEVEAFKRNPTPMVVTFAIPAGVPSAEEVKKEYAAAMRAKLATRTTVVPEGVKAPENAAELRITITELRGPGSDPSPAKVGVITGVAVGTLSAITGHRDAVFDGFFWGLWAGAHASNARRYDMARLGYRPMQVQAQVALFRAGDPEPLEAFAVEPYEVIDAMDPLNTSEKDDEFRVREEEAKAFARVIVFKIQERFNWLPLAKPSWYGVKEGVSREDEAPVKPVEPTEAPKVEEPTPAPAPSPEPPKNPEPAPAPAPAPDPAPKS
jgi:hypothetical protein